MQALIRGHQCLNCGEVTDAVGNMVVPLDPGPNLSNAGFPVVEIGIPTPVVLATPGAPDDNAVEGGDDDDAYNPTAGEAPTGTAEETDLASEESIDLSNLTPEQLAEIQAIVSG